MNSTRGFAGSSFSDGADVSHHEPAKVGARTLTQSLGHGSAARNVRGRLDHARSLIEIIRAQLLPRGRAAAAELRRDLAELSRELREARQLTRDPEERAEIDELTHDSERLRFEAAPILDATPAPAHAAPGDVRIAHATDIAPTWDETRATLDDSPAVRADAPAAWNETPDTLADPVQRRATHAPADDTDVHATAAAGVAGTGSPLPHLDTIQRAFGPHDLSAVQSHVGGPAASAATAIGAEAYATGNHVAFAHPPSLFVAAHEAAHVVQQRAGVHLLGGLGQSGDSYEHHADAVATRVVAGESAADLLGDVGNASGSAVQRKETTAADLTEPKAVNLDSASVDALVGVIRIYVEGAIEAQQDGLNEVAKTLMKPPAVEESTGEKIAKQFALLAVEMALGPVGDVLVAGLKHWAADDLDHAAGKVVIDHVKSFTSTMSDVAKTGMESKLKDDTSTSGDPEDGYEPAIESKFDPLRDFLAHQGLALKAKKFRVAANLELMKADLLQTPIENLKALASALVLDEGDLAKISVAQQRSTMLAWMNACAALTIGSHEGKTFMPGANEAEPPVNDQTLHAWHALNLPGFVDIRLLYPETIHGAEGIELLGVSVNASEDVAHMLRRTKMALDTLPVDRRVHFGFAPAFAITRSGEIELYGAHWVLQAMGLGEEVDAKAFDTAQLEEASDDRNQEAPLVATTAEDRQKAADRKLKKLGRLTAAHKGARAVVKALKDFTTAKAE